MKQNETKNKEKQKDQKVFDPNEFVLFYLQEKRKREKFSSIYTVAGPIRPHHGSIIW